MKSSNQNDLVYPFQVIMDRASRIDPSTFIEISKNLAKIKNFNETSKPNQSSKVRSNRHLSESQSKSCPQNYTLFWANISSILYFVDGLKLKSMYFTTLSVSVVTLSYIFIGSFWTA